jgi:1-acyl-sn-glycerol-3-phosphate acyltransferase
MASLSIARADPLGPVRLFARLAAALLLLIFCLPAHYLWRVSRQASPWPRLFLAGVARIFGAAVETQGRPLRHDVFFIANHLSWMDILVMAGATGTAFVAKDDVQRTPVVGWLATLNNTVFVARTDRRSVAAQVEAVRAAVEAHQPITIFPEGTTGDGQVLLPFKASLLAVLSPPPRDIRVQPVLIDYGGDTPEIAWVGDEPGGENAARILKRRGSFAARLTFLEPFDPTAHPDRKAIAAEAHRRIAQALTARGPAGAAGR